MERTFWHGGLVNPNSKPHPKFRQYTTITIAGPIFVLYLLNNLSRYSSGSVKYYGKSYKLPADVFLDGANWLPNLSPFFPVPIIFIGIFRYQTKSGNGRLVATGAVGQSIFWKVQ